jgi:hypothetical protein
MVMRAGALARLHERADGRLVPRVGPEGDALAAYCKNATPPSP